MKSSVLTLNNITKTFKQQNALDNVSLNIQEGDIYGLIGRNGAGKTTLMKIITSLSKETSGTISLFGATKQGNYQQALSRTASIIEQPVAFERLTAKQNLEYYCLQRGITDKDAVNQALRFVDLTDTGKKKYKQFSLGMKQKLGLAIALLSNPDFLILDEPINGLDPIAITEFRQLLVKINKERNTTILISSHILTELYHVVNRFGIIHRGAFVKEMSKKEFDDQCQEAIVLKVDDPSKTAIILKEELDCDFKIIGDDEIRVYNFTGEIADLNFKLAKENIRVQSITTVGTDLENYFIQIVEDAEKKIGGNTHDSHN